MEHADEVQRLEAALRAEGWADFTGLAREQGGGSPLGQLFLGHRPRHMGCFGLALSKSPSLLGWGDREVVHLHDRTEVCCCLP